MEYLQGFPRSTSRGDSEHSNKGRVNYKYDNRMRRRWKEYYKIVIHQFMRIYTNKEKSTRKLKDCNIVKKLNRNADRKEDSLEDKVIVRYEFVKIDS